MNPKLTQVSASREVQVGGDHYRRAIQIWDIVEVWELDFFEGSCLKYLLRWRHKNGLEDLKKCRHYLDKMIEMAESSAGDATR